MSLRTLRDLLASYNSGVMRARPAYAAEAGGKCGTYAGYRRHVRNGEPTCHNCRVAYRRHRYGSKEADQ